MTRRTAILLLTVFAALVPARFAFAAGAYSVEEFMARKDKWNELQSVQVRVEGRYASIGKNIVRFERCPLTFRGKREFGKPIRNTRSVEVSGYLSRQGARHVFVVLSLRELASDGERFRTELGRIERDNYAETYELCEWALRRGRFYDDKKLTATAQTTCQRTISMERRAKARGDSGLLLGLSEKAWQFQLPDAFVNELKHEAYVVRWQQLKKQSASAQQLEALARELSDKLPGATAPLKALSQETADAYAASPLTYYSKADADQRKRLHRRLRNAIWQKRILLEANAEGSNGFEVAALLDEHLPEQHALAESFRERELQFEFVRAEKLTRRRMLALAARFKERKNAVRAKETIERWLAAREEQYRQDGESGLLQLADEYVTLLDDSERAAPFLTEAYGRNPKSKEINSRLQRLGYTLRDGKWLTREQSKTLPVSELTQAMREGRVSVGMTAQQVHKTLGRPTSVVRSVTAGEVSEVWIYGDRNSSRLTVSLLRRPTRRDATVVDVAEMQTPK